MPTTLPKAMAASSAIMLQAGLQTSKIIPAGRTFRVRSNPHYPARVPLHGLAGGAPCTDQPPPVGDIRYAAIPVIQSLPRHPYIGIIPRKFLSSRASNRLFHRTIRMEDNMMRFLLVTVTSLVLPLAALEAQAVPSMPLDPAVIAAAAADDALTAFAARRGGGGARTANVNRGHSRNLSESKRQPQC